MAGPVGFSFPRILKETLNPRAWIMDLAEAHLERHIYPVGIFGFFINEVRSRKAIFLTGYILFLTNSIMFARN
jgi:hypothetical protein